MHGPRVESLIWALEQGESPKPYNYVEEKIFSALPDVTVITVDGVKYKASAL